MHASEIRVATGSPAQVAESDWPSLARMLDHAERRHSARFAFQPDRRAYILSHALRRALLASELGVAPESIHFGEDERGKPVLRHPHVPGLYFSHSRSKSGVACAMTRIAPVGIDVEPIDPARADVELLEPYVALDSASAFGGQDFFRYWTALEAFWKSAGTGLARGNPRLRLRPGAQPSLIRFEGGEDTPCGLVLGLKTLPGCAIAVALRMPFTGDPVVHGTHCRSARDVEQLGTARAPETLAVA